MATAPASPGPGRAERPSIWVRPERGHRGPIPAHTRVTIVAAAVALADAGGLEAVSMRAVAAALGTSTGGLYRYLSSRDDLLDLMYDAVVGELEPYPEAEDDWLGAMLLLGRGQLALHRRHPWLIDLTPRSTGIGPHSLSWFDACLRVLESVPASVTARFEAVALMTGVVTLVARSETAPRANPFAGFDLEPYPHLASALDQQPGGSPEQDLFERTLRALLTGLLVSGSGGGVPPVHCDGG